ncbi:hypothetical protein KI387_031149, partial [Taxus chinensis]
STQILSLFQEGITLGLGADAASLEKWVNEKDELILSIDEDSGELNNCSEDVPVDPPLDNNQMCLILPTPAILNMDRGPKAQPGRPSKGILSLKEIAA